MVEVFQKQVEESFPSCAEDPGKTQFVIMSSRKTPLVQIGPNVFDILLYFPVLEVDQILVHYRLPRSQESDGPVCDVRLHLRSQTAVQSLAIENRIVRFRQNSNCYICAKCALKQQCAIISNTSIWTHQCVNDNQHKNARTLTICVHWARLFGNIYKIFVKRCSALPKMRQVYL